jgi:hypothetical protein
MLMQNEQRLLPKPRDFQPCPDFPIIGSRKLHPTNAVRQTANFALVFGLQSSVTQNVYLSR